MLSCNFIRPIISCARKKYPFLPMTLDFLVFPSCANITKSVSNSFCLSVGKKLSSSFSHLYDSNVEESCDSLYVLTMFSKTLHR